LTEEKNEDSRTVPLVALSENIRAINMKFQNYFDDARGEAPY
jgi:hypothetical protein